MGVIFSKFTIMIDFSNTKIAFAYRSTKALKKAFFLFKMVKYPFLVKVITKFTLSALKIHFPVHYFIKPFMFSHFCGGTNLQEAIKTASIIKNFKVYSILDFAAEGLSNEASANAVVDEISVAISIASKNHDIAFSAFKPTALISIDILEKICQIDTLSEEEQKAKLNFEGRFNKLCETAHKNKVRLLIDAEDFVFQNYIDELCEQAMEKYNKEEVLIYTTLQMYRTDRLEYLQKIIQQAKERKYYLGVKLVRGAYMEKERILAAQNGYDSPIYNTKDETDNAYDSAIRLMFENMEHCAVFVGTHNEKSVQLTIDIMEKDSIPNNDTRVFVSQLYGMSDQITFNVADNGYNTAKYIPYGSVKVAIPYLLRRAQENTSVSGQTSRELELVKEELKRRKIKS